jgi:hypothetical protein
VNRGERRLLIGLAIVSMAWLLAHSIAGMGDGVAMFAPALLLAVPLLAGRYIGEDVIERARRARAGAPPVRDRGRSPRPALPRPVAALVPRGGLLLAASLATRPPPVLG